MTWDLAEVIAERKQPQTTVIVYLNEYAGYAKVQLEKALAVESDPEKVSDLEAKLDETEQALAESKYTITLEAIPAKFRQDIHAEANREFPFRRTPFGALAADDPTAERMERENNLLFAAMVRGVENPRGEVKTDWSKEEAFQFIGALPATGQQKVDQAMRQVHEEAEKFLAEVVNPNL